MIRVAAAWQGGAQPPDASWALHARAELLTSAFAAYATAAHALLLSQCAASAQRTARDGPGVRRATRTAMQHATDDI